MTTEPAPTMPWIWPPETSTPTEGPVIVGFFARYDFGGAPNVIEPICTLVDATTPWMVPPLIVN